VKNTSDFRDWKKIKNPCFLRREGRRKRKAGAKNEKAILIIAPMDLTSRQKKRKNARKLHKK